MATGNVVVKQPGNSVSDQARRAAENAVRNAQNSGASKKEVIQARDAAKSDFYQNAVKTAGAGGSGGNAIRNELSDPRHQQNLYNAGLIDTPQTFYTRNAMQQGGGAPREINWTEKAQGAYYAGYAESAARQAEAIAQAEAAARTQPRREALEKYEAWRAEHPVAGRITDKIVDIDERLQQTKAGQKLVEYTTGNDGEFGYTNKKFDTQYENKEGTVSGAAKEAALSTFNNLRQGTSYLATANRYRLDKRVQPVIANYVEGKSQGNAANQDAAAFIRDAYNNPETPVRRDDKGEYITVKNVRVPLDVAKRAEADVYGNNAQSLEVIGGKDTWFQRRSEDVTGIYQGGLNLLHVPGLRDKAHEKINQTVPGMALPFIGVNREVNSVIESGLKGATDAVSAVASAPPAIADKTAKTIDLVAGTKSVRDIKILAGAADAEIASKFVNPLYTAVQESDYSPQDLAYVAGGFLPDHLMAKTGSIFKNRVVRPGRVHASAAIDNAKIAKTNYLNPLTSEADVAAHASKMLGVSVDFETVNKRLPGVYVYNEATGSYKITPVKVKRRKSSEIFQGNNLAPNSLEGKGLDLINDKGRMGFAQTKKSADYLEDYWGDPTKFIPENQPRGLRIAVAEKLGLNNQNHAVSAYLKGIRNRNAAAMVDVKKAAQNETRQLYGDLPLGEGTGSRNLYGVHATSDRLPKQLTIRARMRSESPGLYIGMDTMAATHFLGFPDKIRLGFGINRKIPAVERLIIPDELIAKLDTSVKTRTGAKTVRQSFKTDSEPVFIGKNKGENRRFQSQFTDWNEELIPAARRDGFVASQLPKYGENLAGNLIEHEMAVFDSTRFMRNPWTRQYTYLKGKFVSVDDYVYFDSPKAGTYLPDLDKIPSPASATSLKQKKSLAELREEYVFRNETRVNKITGKVTPLIPISREITNREFKRLTRPGYVDSAMEVGYDLYHRGKRKISTSQKLPKKQTKVRGMPQNIDPSFQESLGTVYSVRAGFANPLFPQQSSSRSSTKEKKSSANTTISPISSASAFPSSNFSAYSSKSSAGSSGRKSSQSSGTSGRNQSSGGSSKGYVPGSGPAIPRMIPPVWLPTMPEKGKKQESKSPTKRQVRVNRLADPLEFLLGGKPAASPAKKTEKKKKKTARRRD